MLNNKAQNLQPIILNDNPAGFWIMNDTDNVMRDSSGNGRNGTYRPETKQILVTDALITGFTNSRHFSGNTSGYENGQAFAEVFVPSFEQYSLELWFKVSKYNTNSYARLITYGGDACAIAFMSNGKIQYFDGGTMGSAWHVIDYVVPINSLVHLIFTRSTNGVKVYVNSVKVYEEAGRGKANPGSTITLAGTNSGTEATDMKASCVALYPYPLSQEQVSTHYRFGTSLPKIAGHTFAINTVKGMSSRILPLRGIVNAIKIDSPLFYYPLNASGDVALDPINLGSAIVGPATVRGIVGEYSIVGMGFGSTNQYVWPQSHVGWAAGKTALSIEAWICTTDTSTTYNRDVAGWWYKGECFLTTRGGKIVAKVRDTGGFLNATSIQNVADGHWHHVVMTFQNPGYLRIYVDGVLSASTVTSGPVNNVSSSDYFSIGTYRSSAGVDGGGRFVGSIAHVAAYGYALSATRISEHYQSVVLSSKLTGIIIGTPGSWDNIGNTIAKVFDGDVNSFYDSTGSFLGDDGVMNGGWAGLDLGTPKIIKKIRWAFRGDFVGRAPGCKFQISNDEHFTTNTTLYTITSVPSGNSWNFIDLSANNIAARYVRAWTPDGAYGNFAEVEFYGQ